MEKLKFGDPVSIAKAYDFEGFYKEKLLAKIVEYCDYCTEKQKEIYCGYLEKMEGRISIFRIFDSEDIIVWSCHSGGRFLITDLNGDFYEQPDNDRFAKNEFLHKVKKEIKEILKDSEKVLEILEIL